MCCSGWAGPTQYNNEIESLRKEKAVPAASYLCPLHPFIDSPGILRVGGHLGNLLFAFSQQHLVILYGQYPLTQLIIQAEHIRLLHAGPTLLSSSLTRHFHIVGQRKAVHTTTCACVVCRKTAAKPQLPLMGQLPVERITPGI